MVRIQSIAGAIQHLDNQFGGDPNSADSEFSLLPVKVEGEEATVQIAQGGYTLVVEQSKPVTDLAPKTVPVKTTLEAASRLAHILDHGDTGEPMTECGYNYSGLPVLPSYPPVEGARDPLFELVEQLLDPQNQYIPPIKDENDPALHTWVGEGGAHS